MSNFLEGVRVFNVLAQSSRSGSHGAQPADASDTQSHSEEPPPSSGKHHADDGDNDFLAVPLAAIVFTFLYLIVKAIMAPFHNKNQIAGQKNSGGGLTQEEVAVLQKLQRTLSQMESRVEALETILIEQARTEKNYGPKL